jgi:hypothetical protein
MIDSEILFARRSKTGRKFAFISSQPNFSEGRFVYTLAMGTLAAIIAAPVFAQTSDSSRMAGTGSVTRN